MSEHAADAVPFEARRHERFLITGLQILNEDGSSVDLSGMALRMHVRAAADGPLLLEFSTENGRIIITDAASGTLTLDAPKDAIGALTPGTYLHDLAIHDSGNAVLWAGTFKILPQITH